MSWCCVGVVSIHCHLVEPTMWLMTQKLSKVATSNSNVTTRWCPSSLAFSWVISTISLGLMNGGYIELVIGIINQRSHHWGGTTLYQIPLSLYCLTTKSQLFCWNFLMCSGFSRLGHHSYLANSGRRAVSAMVNGGI